MSRSEFDYLRHILDEIKFLENSIASVTAAEFFQSETLRRASVRSLEIIGQASKNISNEFKEAHLQIEWKAMAGMRDKLIHHYFGVDYEIVWDVVVHKIPGIKCMIMALFEGCEGSDNTNRV